MNVADRNHLGPQSSLRCMRGALLAVATVLAAGCGHMAERSNLAAPPADGGFSVSPASFEAGTKGQQGALCVGRGGVVEACSPRPLIKFEVDKLAAKPLVDIGRLPPADRPAWVLCRVNYRETPPNWECAEIYNRLPR